MESTFPSALRPDSGDRCGELVRGRHRHGSRCRTEGTHRDAGGQALGTGIVKSRIGYRERMSDPPRPQLSTTPSLPSGGGVVLPVQKSERRGRNETNGRAHAVSVVAGQDRGRASTNKPEVVIAHTMPKV